MNLSNLKLYRTSNQPCHSNNCPCQNSVWNLQFCKGCTLEKDEKMKNNFENYKQGMNLSGIFIPNDLKNLIIEFIPNISLWKIAKEYDKYLNNSNSSYFKLAKIKRFGNDNEIKKFQNEFDICEENFIIIKNELKEAVDFASDVYPITLSEHDIICNLCVKHNI